jgi:hypothetical protein
MSKRVREDLLSKIKDSIVDIALENANNDLDHLLKAARGIRQEVVKCQSWIFDGSFEDYQPPDMLHTLIKWIIAEPKNRIETDVRKTEVDKTVNNITQLISQSMKSQCQMNYKASTEGGRGFYQSKETPAMVGLDLLIHKKTRSKEIVKILADLNLSIDYDHTLRILTDIADAVTQKMKENNGVYVPPQIIPTSPVWNNTADGKK